MISADVKAHIKQQDKNNFLQEVPLRLEILCKTGMYFLFSFSWYFIKLDIIVHYKQGLEGLT